MQHRSGIRGEDEEVMTRHELARLRSAHDDLTNWSTDRQRRRGIETLEELIDDARAEHEAEDRAVDVNFMEAV